MALFLSFRLRAELEWTTILGSTGVDVLLDVGVHASGTIFAGGVSTGDFQGERNASSQMER